MKSLSLTFQIHQPFHLKPYRFSDICNDPQYYDDLENEKIIKEASNNWYLPTNEKLLDLIKKHEGGFRLAFSISGTALDQFSLYAPHVIESFQRLAETGNVEFLAEPYAHSLAFLMDREEFIQQVKSHSEKIFEFFGQSTKVFKNTELIYNDSIGAAINEIGFDAVITEGDRHILKWRSPNYVYRNPIAPDLSILFRNIQLNDSIAFRFANPEWTGWPRIENSYLSILNKIPDHENIVNLFMDYELICQGQQKANKSFNFLNSFPSAVFEMTDYNFMTPSEIYDFNKPLSEISVPETISRQDNEGGDLSGWMGNELQKEAFDKLYGLKEKIKLCNDPKILRDWNYLQSTDHFYYMCAKFFSNKEVSSLNNPYNNPYEAFINYMNVLNDFSYRIYHSVLNLKSDYIQKKHQFQVETQ
jgi:alpha-amylase